MKQFQQQWNLDSIYIADRALYSTENLQQLGELSWVTRVPRSLKAAKFLVESLEDELFTERRKKQSNQAFDYRVTAQMWVLHFFGSACQKYYLIC